MVGIGIDMNIPITAQCTVDPMPDGRFWVEVWGDDDSRAYVISADSDDKAAQTGLTRYVDEISELRDNA